MAWTLIIVTSLVVWALHLMEGAVHRQEFSRMLAGMMVVAAAGGVLTTYFVMSDYLAFLHDAKLLSSFEEISFVPMPGELGLEYGFLTE
ncbi:MAG: hypothetical protein AAFY57_11620 [Cyanobacteria bacterium J06642_2]